MCINRLHIARHSRRKYIHRGSRRRFNHDDTNPIRSFWSSIPRPPRKPTGLRSVDHSALASLASVLDLRSGCWQVPLSPSARPKTAFTIGRGLLEFNVIPFGLCNSLATFEWLMEKVLQPVPVSDDILVHASTYVTALTNLHTVFELIAKANLCLNPVKCSLFHQQTSFLKHVVSKRGISTDPAKVWKNGRHQRQLVRCAASRA
ncbi:hypothetical protein AAFF_G00266360 [Aldrovandia affinis]|uniref:ribonuclease H n=1 Tax=Aldrovandia affinis TaxID=143900 RepID=A0AAD7RBA8_9TELE|nr:hypothetical protein AAFF_G00266360 [Aldrovandia affinis]